ncbi:vacuolar proton-inorganic pyrophosphatase [Hordeum vulgare]|nr:vacuolar proton-inorganic pyrophosphatase [Hordeum vulgare]
MVVVPVAAAVGIAFAVLQWVLVSKVKVTTEPRVEGGEASASGCKYGASEYLIEEEEGLNDHNVVPKCAEIQTAISEGETCTPHTWLFLGGRSYWSALRSPSGVDRSYGWGGGCVDRSYGGGVDRSDEDCAVATDNELQAWWSEVRNVGHGDLSDAPWWPAMYYVDDLVETCAAATSTDMSQILDYAIGREFEGVFLDYARQQATTETVDKLFKLAEASHARPIKSPFASCPCNNKRGRLIRDHHRRPQSSRRRSTRCLKAKRSNLQLLPLALQLQFTLHGPAFRATQRCHHMGFFPLAVAAGQAHPYMWGAQFGDVKLKCTFCILYTVVAFPLAYLLVMIDLHD